MSSGNSGGLEPLACVESVLDPAVGDLAHAMTQTEATTAAPAAGNGQRPRSRVRVARVPTTRLLRARHPGLDYDTVLYLRDDCDGAELNYGDGGEGVGYSSLVGPFVADQRVVVVLDGTGGEVARRSSTSAAVEALAPTSADSRCREPPTSLAATTTAAGGDGVPERCVPLDRADRRAVVLPRDLGDFVPALYLETGPICGGPLLELQRRRGRPR
ncbi:MAG: hypothetical protein U0168_21830 [Nannocystaceae bacterium]